MSDIRIVVVINDANPELLSEFEKTSTRSRAERMRVLATLGLKLVSGASNMGTQQATVEPSIQPTNRIQVAQKATKVKSVETALVEEQTKTEEGASPSNTVDTEITNSTPVNSSRRNSRVAKFARSLGAG